MQFILPFPTFISCLYGSFPHKQQDSFSRASPLILFTMRTHKHVQQEKRMEQNWEWMSSWRRTEQDFLFQWQCQFKQDYGICCYLVVSPDKVTRSCKFPYKSWVMGRPIFYVNCPSVFWVQPKGSIFGPSWENPFSWNVADGHELFNRCLASPRPGLYYIKGNLSGTHNGSMWCAA